MELHALPIISRVLHIGAVIVAIGGAAFILLALGPAMAVALDEAAQQRLRSALRDRWRRFVHICIGLILLSGLLNAHAAFQGGRPTLYMLMFVVKLLAALAVFFVASALAGRSPAFEAMRLNPRPWLGTILALAGLIVILAVFMHAMPAQA